jgi:hypothetical protein
MVIAVSGTTAPLVSVTVPVMVPNAPCPNAPAGTRRHTNAATNAICRFSIALSFQILPVLVPTRRKLAENQTVARRNFQPLKIYLCSAKLQLNPRLKENDYHQLENSID